MGEVNMNIFRPIIDAYLSFRTRVRNDWMRKDQPWVQKQMRIEPKPRSQFIDATKRANTKAVP